MTFCLGIRVRDGLVGLADTRITSGNEVIVARKVATFLASQPGVVRTRQQLLAAVWNGQAFVTERSIDTLVRHLRCKIEEDAAAPQLILTVWGYGYKFADA